MRKLIDLTGHKFGRLTVTKRGEDYISPKGRKEIRWYCDCECGTKNKLINGSHLKSGKTQSCGCFRSEIASERIDLTGQRFGKWVVIRRGEDYVSSNGIHETRYYCNCDCGTKDRLVRASSLKSGGTKSCGCVRPTTSPKKIDLTGQKFGRLTVIREKSKEEYLPNKRRCVQWYCNCDCGTKDHLVDAGSLSNGHVQSCGCLQREMASIKNASDLVGMKFGRLTVLERTEQPLSSSSKIKGVWWMCQCECGNIVPIRGRALTINGTQSCGCLVSRSEELIRKILVENNVKFESQYTFEDCRSPTTNYLLKFDFAIFKKNDNLKCLIEYDGEQHYTGWGFLDKERNEEKLKQTIMYDNIKNEYCKSHNIKLIRIPYWEFNNIETILKNILKE